MTDWQTDWLIDSFTRWLIRWCNWRLQAEIGFPGADAYVWNASGVQSDDAAHEEDHVDGLASSRPRPTPAGAAALPPVRRVTGCDTDQTTASHVPLLRQPGDDTAAAVVVVQASEILSVQIHTRSTAPAVQTPVLVRRHACPNLPSGHLTCYWRLS